jgi:hypothetical protein
MNENKNLFTAEEMRIFDAALDFLEETYQKQEFTQQDSTIQGEVREALILNLAKVMNDCRAILLLAQSGLYIQAGILARSTTDACNLVMHIEFSEDDATLVEPWLAGRKVTHWMLIEEINESLEQSAQVISRTAIENFLAGSDHLPQPNLLEKPGALLLDLLPARYLVARAGPRRQDTRSPRSTRQTHRGRAAIR